MRVFVSFYLFVVLFCTCFGMRDKGKKYQPPKRFANIISVVVRFKIYIYIVSNIDKDDVEHVA